MPAGPTNRPIARAIPVLIAVLHLLLPLSLPTTLQAQSQFRAWENKDGKQIMARYDTYQAATKKIRWKLPDGTHGETPLAALSTASKWDLILTEPSFNQIVQSRIRSSIPAVITIAILTCLLLATIIIGGLLLDTLALKSAATLLCKREKEFTLAIKLLLASIVLTLANAAFEHFARVDHTGPDLHPAHIILLTIQFLLSLGISIAIVCHHYLISFIRSLGILILRAIATLILSIPIALILGILLLLTAAILYLSLDPLLRSLDLI